jgi:hypothetical protein
MTPEIPEHLIHLKLTLKVKLSVQKEIQTGK